MKQLLTVPLLVTLACLTCPGADHVWQTPQAKILPTGDLEWMPRPFEFTPGEWVKHIDFEAGDDAADGTRDAPWKHHPWDRRATGRARAHPGPTTYVFKRGVIYRGALHAGESGVPDDPIRLTSDPAWGDGEAAIYGSEPVDGWHRMSADAAPDGMPQPDKVWAADLDFSPRAVWLVDGQDVTRIVLARMPNWTVTDPYDVRSGWWTWENPKWWEHDYRTTVDKTRMHQGIDTRHLTGDSETYEGALVWSEWGIMMGAPYAAPVDRFDPESKAVAFQGPWHRDSGKVMANNRYYLEDKPHFLDAPGEYWFDRRPDGKGGRLYVRLPDDADPNDAVIEVGKRVHMLEAADISHIEVSGLTFAFANVFWRLDHRFFQHADVDSAAVRILGGGTDITVRNNRFLHTVKAVRIETTQGDDVLDRVRVTDNDVAFTDHGGIHVKADGGGVLRRVDVLRNRLREIGRRPMRPNGHFAMVVSWADVANIAGNVLDRCYAAGIDMHGGKGSGKPGDAPFVRYLVWNNKVTHVNLGANDWGGIETWQGGPFYVYNNVVGNPVGPMHWAGKTFSHAYYLDGAFKNYHFNNIAWGRVADPARKRESNVSAFQEIHSYQNTFFNNTAYNFLKGSRRQKAEPGRDKFLGNVFTHIAENVFRHSDKEGEDPNVHHAGAQGDVFDHATNAYADNVMYAVGDVIASFEAAGGDYRDLDQLRDAMARVKPLAGSVGVIADDAPLRDAQNHDFRPAPGSAVQDRGATVFVPWSLHGTVGEWHFTRNNHDPAVVIDEHWYLTDYHRARDDYETRPMHPLRAVGVSATDYERGPLEDWTDGALRLNGKDQYLTIPHSDLTKPYRYPGKATKTEGGWAAVTLPVTAKVGVPFQVKVMFDDPPKGQKVGAHLHWLKSAGFGGFNAWGGHAKAVSGKGPYTFTFTPETKDGLARFSLAVYLSPDGEWDTQTKVDRIVIEPGDGKGTRTVALGGSDRTTTAMVTVSGEALKNPQVHRSSVIVEAYLKIEPGRDGCVLRKTDGSAGYALSIDGQGRPVFRTLAAGHDASVTGDADVADGQWHHLLAEADREEARLRLYLDSTLLASAAGPGPGVSLANDGDLLVGGTPDGDHLAVSIDFLRVALGTLAQSRTTIEELYAWQFDGPFLHDFTGRRRKTGKSAAGAIDGP